LEQSIKGVYHLMKVAIKIINSEDSAIFNILREASILTAINSDKIIKCYGIIIDNNSSGLITEYMKHGNFFKRFIQNDHELTWNLFSKIALDVVYGLQYLHYTKQIVHGDIKAENILLDDHDNAKLADFGESIIKLNLIDDKSTIGGIKGAGGTFNMLAPELMSKFNNYTFSSDSKTTTETDIYSVGLLLIIFSTRRIPFSEYFPLKLEYFKNLLCYEDPNLFNNDSFETRLLNFGKISINLNQNTPIDLYTLIRKTTLPNPNNSITINDIVAQLNIQKQQIETTTLAIQPIRL